MLFEVQDRLLILCRLSEAKGNMATLRVVRDLENELGFSEQEHKDLNFRYEHGKTLWDASNVPLKEISIGLAALDVVFLPLQGLMEAGQLPRHLLEFYEKLEKAKAELSTPKLAAV